MEEEGEGEEEREDAFRADRDMEEGCRLEPYSYYFSSSTAGCTPAVPVGEEEEVWREALET